MYTIRKKFKIEYAHQLCDAYTKECNDTIHGHSGQIELFFQSAVLNKQQMVVDFGKINALLKNYINEEYDHALIIPTSLNSDYISMLKKYNKKIRIYPKNPTAEYFCFLIHRDVTSLLSTCTDEFRLSKVRFHETDTGYAEYIE